MKRLWIRILGVAFAATLPAFPVTLNASFSSFYTLDSLTPPNDVTLSYGVGAIQFQTGSSNVLLQGGFADFGSGVIDAVSVHRDSSSHITGFSDSTSIFATAPDIDAGLAYGPGGDLFFTQYSDNTVGEIQPGGTSASYTASLPGVPSSTGGLAFIPTGFGGAGNAAITSFNGDSICSASVTSNGSGGYNFGTCSDTVTFSSNPEGIAYVPAGTPGFAANSILINFYELGTLTAFNLDANGMPILATGVNVVTGLERPAGIAVDPVTGDILIDCFLAGQQWTELQVNSTAPEPGTGGIAVIGLASLFVGLIFYERNSKRRKQ